MFYTIVYNSQPLCEIYYTKNMNNFDTFCKKACKSTENGLPVKKVKIATT